MFKIILKCENFTMNSQNVSDEWTRKAHTTNRTDSDTTKIWNLPLHWFPCGCKFAPRCLFIYIYIIFEYAVLSSKIVFYFMCFGFLFCCVAFTRSASVWPETVTYAREPHTLPFVGWLAGRPCVWLSLIFVVMLGEVFCQKMLGEIMHICDAFVLYNSIHFDFYRVNNDVRPWNMANTFRKRIQ